MDWYYEQNGAADGPVSGETFRSLVANGTIRPETLVWHDGMPEWQPLSVADPRYATGGAGAPPPVPGVFVPAGATATFAELKQCAKSGPPGNYWTFTGAMLLWWLAVGILGWVGNMLVAGLFSFGAPSTDEAAFSAACGLISGFLAVRLVLVLFQLLQQYGFANMGLRGADHRKLEVGDAFVGFTRFGRAFGCMFMMGLFTFLWSLLLVIPGIVKSFSYMLTPYIVLEHPEMPVVDAIDESRRLMDGNKWRAFLLGLSFIGWILLAFLTLGILFFWLVPYMQITFGAFYRAVLREKGAAPSAPQAA